MHTALVILGGFALLAVCVLLGRNLGPGGNAGMVLAAKVFIPLWLVGALVNLWVGVSTAGYTVMEEMPIFLFVFAVPAAVAGFLWWKWS